MKKQNVFILLLTLLFIFSLTVPHHSQASEGKLIEVTAGYKNEAGKQLLLEKSKLVHETFHHVQAVAATMEEQILDEIRNHPNISYAEKNITIELAEEQTTFKEIIDIKQLQEKESWNLQSISAPSAWKEGFTGKGVKVAVIDSGIAAHPDLNVAGGYAAVDYTESWDDDNGHGTHVAGIIGAELNDEGIAGVAPDAEIYAVKVLDEKGNGNLFDFIDAINWAIENEMDIINLSLGTESESAAMKNIIDTAHLQGTLITGASGNNGAEGTIDYPAKFESVMAVSAIDQTLNISTYSSRGQEIEFSAPGSEVISTYLNNTYAKTSGTSVASPHVAGMLAVLKQRYPDMESYNLRTELIQHVEDLGNPGRDSLYGHGLIYYSLKDTVAPAEVTDITKQKVDVNTIHLNWTPPADEDFEKVNIYHQGNLIASVQASVAQQYIFTDLQEATEYSYVFKTLDRLGNESAGVEFSMTTKAVAPAEAEVTDKTTTDKQLEEKQTVKEQAQVTSEDKSISGTPVKKFSEAKVETEPKLPFTEENQETAEKSQSEKEVVQQVKDNTEENSPIRKKERNRAVAKTDSGNVPSSYVSEEEPEVAQPKKETVVTVTSKRVTDKSVKENKEESEEPIEIKEKEKEEDKEKNFFQKIIGGIVGFINGILTSIGSFFTNVIF